METCATSLISSDVLGLVEEAYHQNPYHNAVHAADVTQAMHCYILQEKVILSYKSLGGNW